MDSSAASVIVCAYSFDRLDETVAAVESVIGQTMQPHEIIVSVDNNPPLVHELASRLPGSVSVILHDGVRGESGNRNTGGRRATGSIIAFMDDDALAERDWLEKLVKPFQDPTVVAVGGRSVPAWERGQAPQWFPSEYEFMIGCTGHLDRTATQNNEIRNPAGSNMAFREGIVEPLGGWRLELGRGPVQTGGTEAEMCLRIKDALPDALIVYAPSAVVHHKVSCDRATVRYVFTYAYHEGLVRAMLRKYTSAYTSRPLAAEKRYLRSLLTIAIPQRLKSIYRLSSLAQLSVIVVNIILIGLGYIRGRIAYR